MDIWSRLLGSNGGASASKRADGASPQQRLIRFKKAHDQLQHIWRRNNATTKVAVLPEPVFQCLHTLKVILREEVQTPLPHLCARHVSTFNVHVTIAQVASTYNEETIVENALEIFKILLDSEEADFAKDKAFADALIGYVSALSLAGLNNIIEEQMVEVLFAVTAKLRTQPDILPAWFRPSSRGLTTQDSDDPRAASLKEDFPLFYETVDYIHRDGRIGDFARTGVLYLIESAGQSAELEQWIIESDLATLMASGLGALYSQLSRKLVLAFDEDSTPAIITFSESPRVPNPNDADTNISPAFKGHLATFLSHLVFWQDALEHCTSTEVKRSLLDHFKFLFLQQLLYPSLIESSDRDGGSSVAVLTYLRCIIESIDDPDLTSIVFQYLLAVPEVPKEDSKSQRPTTLARRRKSQNLVTNLARGQEKPLPDLFNLIDLILASLRSRDQQTVTATLRLVCLLLRNRHQYRIPLLKTITTDPLQTKRSMTDHEQLTTSLFSMIEHLADSEDLEDTYAMYLEDVQGIMENHECAITMLALPDADQALRITEPRQMQSVDNGDPLMQALVDLLKSFLINDIEANLALTQAFSTLACCGSVDLGGWLLVSRPNQSEGDFKSKKGPRESAVRTATDSDLEKPEKVTSEAVPTEESRKGLADECLDNDDSSPVFAALDSLIRQVEVYRQNINNFDIFLTERRHVFRVGENIDEALVHDSQSGVQSSRLSITKRPLSKARGPPQFSSISERLQSTQGSMDGSRASSPRGRPPEISPASALAGRLSHLRISPSPMSRKPRARALSSSPLRENSRSSRPSNEGHGSSTPPKRVATPMGPADALRQKVKVFLPSTNVTSRSVKRDISGSRETSSVRNDPAGHETKQDENYQEVSLGHVLTNVVLLQEFMLELVAVVQVRASLFDEVSLSTDEVAGD